MEKFNIYGDSTYLLMLTAQDLQYEVSYCLPSDVYGLNDQALANISELELCTVLHKYIVLWIGLKLLNV